MSASGGEARSLGKISGRLRGNGIVSAVASELAATTNATKLMRLADTFQRPPPTAGRPYTRQQLPIMVQFFGLAPVSRYGRLVPDHQTCCTSEKFHFQNGRAANTTKCRFGSCRKISSGSWRRKIRLRAPTLAKSCRRIDRMTPTAYAFGRMRSAGISALASLFGL
jgi:hypothetical protein